MLLFSRLRNRARRIRGGAPPGAPPTGARDDGNSGGSGRSGSSGHIAVRPSPPSTSSVRHRMFLKRLLRVSLGRKKQVGSKTRSPGIVGALSSPPDVMGDPMESFSSVTSHGLGGAVKHNDVPKIIASKIQGHHELWYRLAYGRSRDRRVSGGYALQPAMLGGVPLLHPKYTEGSGQTHIPSWKSRPNPWLGDPGSPPSELHMRVTSIDYGNAEEVVLASTEDVDINILYDENTLPIGAPRFMIHPYGKHKVVWDIFVAVLIVYGCISIPLHIGFDLEASQGQKAVDLIVDTVFLVDMILSFRTAFMAPDGEVVTNSSAIGCRYLRGSFTIDLCSTVPVDLIASAFGGSGGILRSTKLLRTLRLLRLARLLKLSKIIGGKEDDMASFFHPSLWALIKMFVMLLFIAHLMACMWHWLAVLRPNGITWVSAYGVEETTWEHQYLVGIYWAFTTMTTVGYGDITSSNNIERCFAIVGMIIGATVFGYIIGNVAVIVENFNVVDAIETAKMNEIKEWLYDRKFPPALAEKIRRQYRSIFKKMSVFDSSEIMDVMPGVISTSLIYAQYRAVSKGVLFLAKRPPVLVCRLVRRMVPAFANSGDVLYLEHEVGGHWYILRGGNISFYVSLTPLETQSEVLQMRTMASEGNFGLAPLLLNVLNSETATATTAADLLTIRKDDLVDILQQWPEIMAELTREAERLFRGVKSFRASKLLSRPGVHPELVLPVVAEQKAGKPKAPSAGTRTNPTSLTPERKVSPDYGGSGLDALDINVVKIETNGWVGCDREEPRRSGKEGGGGIGMSSLMTSESKTGKGINGVNIISSSVVGGGDVITEELETGDKEEGRPLEKEEEKNADGSGVRETYWSKNKKEEGEEKEKKQEKEQQNIAGRSSSEEGGVRSEKDISPMRIESPRSSTQRGRSVTDGPGPGLGKAKVLGVEGRVEENFRTEKSPDGANHTEVEKGDISELAAKVTCASTSAVAKSEQGQGKTRPPPIITEENPTITPQSDGDDTDGSDEFGNSESGCSPEVARGCFVAKTFSPSDLGLGARRRKEASKIAMEPLTRQGMETKGNVDVSERDIRKVSLSSIYGLEETQAVLGGVMPDRVFSITGMFHPDSSVKISWDLWVSMFIVWSVLEITFRLGFDRPAQGGWLIFSYSIDALFFLDMVVSMRTALLTNDRMVVAQQKEVALAYLKGWFFLDLVSTVPWDLLVLNIAVGDSNAAARSTKLLRSLRLVRLVRLIRLLKISDFMEEWETNSPLGPSSVRLGRLLIIMAFSAHLNACVWYAAGLNTSADHSWISDYYCSEEDFSDDCPENKSSFSLYLVSIYFAFTTMTTTGYGDILPNRFSPEELGVAIASEVLGATIFAWVIGNLVNLVINIDPAERNRKSMMNYLVEYMRELPLSSNAKQTITRNYAFHLQIHSVFNQSSILGELLPHLQNQAYVFLWRSMLPKLPFLCSMEDQVTGFMRVVLPMLKPSTFNIGDVVVTPKIGTREMGFITSGEVEVRLARGRRRFKTFILREQRHFGEIFMLLPEHVPFKGLAQVHAMTRVCMMQITRNAFATLEARHPHISSFMSKQLFEPHITPSWVVVNADFQYEVDLLAKNATVSDLSTLQTPRSPEGAFLENFRQEYEDKEFTQPGLEGSLAMRKRLVAFRPSSPGATGGAKPKEPAMRKVVTNKAGRMAGQAGTIRNQR